MTKEMGSFDQQETGKVIKNVASAVLATGIGLSACTPKNVEIKTPAPGEAVPIGLLDAEAINNFPDGEVKNSLQTELNNVKKDCAEIPGCMGDTVQIYRVNVNDENEGVNVFSYRFANVEDAEGLRTQILSVMDGKTKEITKINKDLLAKDTVIDGTPTRVFGYVDDLGNSHYILTDSQTQNGEKFQVYDAEGDMYNVITQNEKEVQAYSHLWQEPSIVKAEALPTPTQESTQTEKAPASAEWQLSPDGHIYYKESELYDGMFTINKEHPEWVEKYWEDTVRGLWNLNNIGENTAFINQFPTDDALVQYLKDGGGTVSNLWIPVIYPNSARQFIRQGTLVPATGQVDLSKIAIAIYKPTTEEIYKYSPSYATGTRYVSYIGAAGEALTELVALDNNNFIKITLRRDLLMDATRLLASDSNRPTDTQEFILLALSAEKTSDENLLAATQLLRSWPLHMQIKDGQESVAWIANLKPPMLNFNSIAPLYHEYTEITTLDETPLAIR